MSDIFDDGVNEMRQKLRRVLVAYAMHDPSVGLPFRSLSFLKIDTRTHR